LADLFITMESFCPGQGFIGILSETEKIGATSKPTPEVFNKVLPAAAVEDMIYLDQLPDRLIQAGQDLVRF
jgi:hypothetical protein